MVSELDPADAIEKIENLILGEGKLDFQELESLTHVFCPFEAIGMVRQEIRHSNFLAYILDPNRPHIFGTKLLEGFLSVISDADAFSPKISALDLHFYSIRSVRVLREWRNIDLLIKLSGDGGNNTQGIVIAVELKIDAQESSGQLEKYKGIVDAEYPPGTWTQAFVFMTPDGAERSNEAPEEWNSIKFEALVGSLEQACRNEQWSGPSADLLRAYIDMVRRHILKNEQLEQLAERIWAKHREAIETLLEYRPNLQNDIFEALEKRHDEMAQRLTELTGREICADTSTKRIRRFYISDWYEKFPELKTGLRGWVKSGSLFAIEISAWSNGRIRVSLVMGLGKEKVRQDVHQAVCSRVERTKDKMKISRLTEKLPPKYKHYSAMDVLTSKQYHELVDTKTEDESVEIGEVAENIIEKSGEFLKEILPKYEEVFEEAFFVTGQKPPG